VTALRDVQRAREPAELRYEAFRGTTGIELTGLGVTLAKPSEVSECRPARRLPCDDSTAAGPLTDAAMGTATDEPIAPAVMQKVVPHPLVVHYLDGGYDRVAGYVHQARDVADLNTPERLVRGLGLTYEGSPFSVDDEAIHVIRWPVLKAALFKTPFGGIDEASMRSARDGWVIERPPFLGTGYAPGDGPPIPEFKIVSQRLPHGAQLFRIERSGEAAQVASFDADGRRWAKGS
jgi:hypothetical protein